MWAALLLFTALGVLAGAGALRWFSVADRTSPLALQVVELESQIGMELWPAVTTLGLALLLARLLIGRLLVARPVASPPRPRPLTRDGDRSFGPASSGYRPPAPAASVAPVAATGEWLAVVRSQARFVSDDAMGRIRFEEAAGVPVTLVLTAITPEQARRRIASFAAWLATIPTPPCARVRLVSSPDIDGPLHRLFKAELARHFPAEAFAVVSAHAGADVLFNRPDPRWIAAEGAGGAATGGQ